MLTAASVCARGRSVSSDVIVAYVTFSAQELGLRLNQRWDFVAIEKGEVRIHGELVAKFDKRGPRVLLSPHGSRELARWVAWAIQAICPDSERSMRMQMSLASSKSR